MSDEVKKIYRCPICKMNHNISFAADFAKNRAKYPFTYVFLHTYEGDIKDVVHAGMNVLTTLFIDADLNIRGVEALQQEGSTDIVSKDDSVDIAQTLTNHILRLQADYDELLAKYKELEKKLNA